MQQNVDVETSLWGIDRPLDQRLASQAPDFSKVPHRRFPVSPTTHGLEPAHTRLNAAAKKWTVVDVERIGSMAFPDPEPAFPERYIGDGTRKEYREGIVGWTE